MVYNFLKSLNIPNDSIVRHSVWNLGMAPQNSED